MKKNIIYLFLATLAPIFALQSCGLEEPVVAPEGDGYIEFVARSISYDKKTVSTKVTPAETATAMAAWENNIYTAFFMVFDNDGNRIIYRDLSPTSGSMSAIPSQTLQKDKRYTHAKVCYLVNVSSDFASRLTTYALLTSTPLQIEHAPISLTGCIGVPLLKKSSEDTGTPAIPMFGYAEDCDFSAVTTAYQTNTIELKRLLAKVDVKLSTQSGITFGMTNYTVNNIPTKVKLVPPSQGDPTAYASSTSSGDFLTSENTMTSYNLIGSNNSVTTGFFFYVPEHMQGGAISKEGVDNSVQSNKPLLISGTAKKPAYVEINGDLSTETAEYTGKYSIYLGKNETNDFDLERNTYYKNTVTIKGLTAENRVELLGGDQYTNLVDGEAANCYIITSVGKYILPAYEGATKSLDGATMCYGKPYKVWSDLDDDAITFTYPDKKDSKIVFEISEAEGKFKAGNAVIAIRDDNNNILWSWHLWFCPGGVPSDQDYGNNNYLMDRFLGAKSTATDGIALVSQYISLYWTDGLYYQWGRKDPLNINITTGDGAYEATEGNDLDLATQNPNTFYKNWASNNGWTVDKAKYDPCPPGYKVPQSSVWSKSKDDFNRFISSNQYIFVYNLSQPTILYPYYGFLNSNGERQSGQMGSGLLKSGTYNMIGLGDAKDYPLYPSTQLELSSKPSYNPRRYDSASYEIVDDKQVGEVWGIDNALEYGYEDRGIIITSHKYQEGIWDSYTSIEMQGWRPVTVTKYRAKYSGNWTTVNSTTTNGVHDDKLPDNVREKFMGYIKAEFTISNLGSELKDFFENLGNLGEWAQQGVVYNKPSTATSNGYNVRCVKETSTE